ncbi:hypothetical protein ACEPAG_9106 [Sanghuangporus baumii]
MTLKRINREIKDLEKEDLGDMTLEPTEDNMFVWKASIPGPEGSPYESGVFNLRVELAPDYPFTAPKVTFVTRIYHMNVSDRGGICIDILKQNWSPALSLYKVLLSLSSLLTDPNPKDPLVPSIASEYIRNRTKHDSTAREWTRLYAQKTKETPVALPNGKGKARASASTSRNEGNGRMRRNARQSQAGQIIDTNGEVIDLSDVEGQQVTSQASQRTSTRTRVGGTKRKRGPDDTNETVGAASSRRRMLADDVIIIED